MESTKQLFSSDQQSQSELEQEKQFPTFEECQQRDGTDHIDWEK